MSKKESLNIYEKLAAIQQELKVPKGQENKSMGYKYRSLEDILEALKPLLRKYKATIVFKDDITKFGDNPEDNKLVNRGKKGNLIVTEFGVRFYVKSTVEFIDLETQEKIKTTSSAREALYNSRQDDSQITGSASSYARKYAVNAMFLIDDTKDSDYLNQKYEIKNQQNTKNKLFTNQKIEQGQLNAIKSIIKNKDLHSNLGDLLAIYRVRGLEELSQNQGAELLKKLQKI